MQASATDTTTTRSRLNGAAREEPAATRRLEILGVDGRIKPGEEAPLSDAETVRVYRAMLTSRLVDERMVKLQRQGRIGFYISGPYEEAAILGPIAALRPSDWLFPCYRENGGYLLRGLPFQRFVDNLFGNADDPVMGRQMPNHIAYRPANVTSVSSPIGTQIPQAVGAAFAAKKLGRDDAMLTFFGEGATSSNDFHTGLNFAGVWKAPVVFVCRNNGWAISVPREKQCAAAELVDKAAGYGMPGVQVDGNDLFACYAAARDALVRARAGEGPTFIEAMTYRVEGHSTSDDPKVYRPETAVEPWRQKDPLIRVQKYLAARGAWTDADEQKVRAEVDEAIKQSVAVAEKTPPPALGTMFEGVFASMPWHLAEQFADARSNVGGKAAEDGAFPL